VGGGIGVQLVEVGDTHGQIGVGEQLDRLRFGGIGEQGVDVLLHRTLLQQSGESLGALGALADDDAGRVQIVVQRTSFAQELG
jgi:hypothetical protein